MKKISIKPKPIGRVTRNRSQVLPKPQQTEVVSIQVEPLSIAKPQKPEYQPVHQVAMRGATAPDGTPWICVKPSDQSQPWSRAHAPGIGPLEIWLPLSYWHGDAKLAVQRLNAANILLFDEDLKDAIKQSRSISAFPPLPLIKYPGWNGPHFALLSGEVISPPESDTAVVLFEKETQRLCAKGDLTTWKKGVAQIAGGQSIVTFALMLQFAAPLLRLSPITFNPGFELAGPKRKGKSSLQHFTAAVVGPAVAQQGRNYWISANSTANALEDLSQQYNDLPIIIEEMGLYYSSDTKPVRARKMQELIHRLASGTVKERKGEASQPSSRFIYLTSTNETLNSMFEGDKSATASAAGDRLLTIPIGAARPYGIFDKLPTGCASSKEAISAIASLVEHHHGGAMRAFLHRLVKQRDRNETKLRKRIEGFIVDFRRSVGIDDNLGSEATIADVFGLIYAAGMLAKRYGALPRSLKCLKAAMKVHKLNRAIDGPALTNLQLLSQLARRKGIIQIDPRHLQEISDGALVKAPALLRTEKSGRIELLLTKRALHRAFSDRKQLFEDPEVTMDIDKDQRKTIKKKVRTNAGQERFYCFVLKP